jgi:hypothetical protein
MSVPDEAWFSLLLLALFGFLFFLRLKFPGASRSSETAVLLMAVVAFFTICGLFASVRRAPNLSPESTQLRSDRR